MNKDLKQVLYETGKGRRFTVMPTLDYYVLREFMIPFSVLVFTFILLFLIGDVFNRLSDFLEAKDGAFLKAVKYFAYLMPGNIRFVLPISILLSCMYTVSSLGRCREITAMRASGISMLRCGGAIYFVALVTTGVNFWFNEQLVPEFTSKAAVILASVRDPNYTKEMYNMLQFRSPDKSRDWFFNNFSGVGVHSRVILKQYDVKDPSNRSLIFDLQAEEAYFDLYSGWEFRNGVITHYNRLLNIPGAGRQFRKLSFTRLQIPETTFEISNAIKPPEELPTGVILHTVLYNKGMAPQLKRSYMTLFYYRLAFPWICFLCVFLGLPLAVKNERSGVFISIVTAVGAIILFQVFTEIFIALGKQGYLPPPVAGLGPTLGFMMYSYFGVIRKSA